MPPLDVQLVVYNQIWALLEASSAFTGLVKVGNRLKSTDARVGERDINKTAPNDFPKVRVDVGEETDNDNGPQTLGMNDPNYSAAMCDYGVPITLNIVVKIVHDKTALPTQTPVEASIRGALFVKGPKLGISWISKGTWRGIRRTDEKNADTGNTLRTVSRARIVIQCRPLLSQITQT